MRKVFKYWHPNGMVQKYNVYLGTHVHLSKARYTLNIFLHGFKGFEMIFFIYLPWLQNFFTTKVSNEKMTSKP